MAHGVFRVTDGVGRSNRVVSTPVSGRILSVCKIIKRQMMKKMNDLVRSPESTQIMDSDIEICNLPIPSQ